MILFFALACGWFSAAAQAPNTLTKDEQAGGWILLFDGRNAKGWLEVSGLPFPTATWTIEDGCLRALDPGTGIQDIRTEATFRSFEFQFDWKVPRDGNSGVKYLVQRTDRWTNQKGLQSRARGLEYQIIDDNSKDAQEPDLQSGSLYHTMAPIRLAARPTGEFNHSLLVVRGAHVEHWLNGVKVVEFETTNPAVWKNVNKLEGLPLPGRETFLSLQNHGTAVWFRNLKVRRLP